MRELIHPGQFAGYQSVVVGGGSSGRAAARLLSALGAKVRLVDVKDPGGQTRTLAEELGFELQVGEHAKSQFADADIVVLSPGVDPRKIGEPMADVPERKIVAELELACWFVTEPIVAVTGTSGKTTTASLIAAMLEAGGRKVFLGGNIGTPLSEYLLAGDPADVLVLEVSSFQLQHSRSFKPHVGVLTNLAPNHLDWHESVQEYFDAKLSMFERMADTDLAVLPLVLKDHLEARSLHAKRVYFVPSARFENARLIGSHNRANLEAAWLAARAMGADEQAALHAGVAFEGLPHRLEHFLTKSGVLFVNDSKATTLDALAAALEAFDTPVLLLVGGVFKGGEPEHLLPLLKNKVRRVCGFGASREVFEKAWISKVPVEWKDSLEAAVQRLWEYAQEGDVMLLSPATSSFDAYDNYKARGDDFKRIAGELT